MNQSENKVPSWLRRTQEGSWEPEILISGIVLLALTQVPRLLDKLHYWLEERTSMFYFYTSAIDDIIIATLKVGTYWLIAGLIFHLIMRSVWVSFVDLSYVFPVGIRTEKLGLQPWFGQRLVRMPDFKQQVIRLENICSTLYAIAFLFVMATISLFAYLVSSLGLGVLIATIFPGIIKRNGATDIILLVITLLLAVPYLLDFITLGWVKRLPHFWRVYRYPYRFMSVITLAPLYRGIYYGLITNINRWRLFALLVFFVGATGLLVFSVEGWGQRSVFRWQLGTSSTDGYYRDQSPDRYSTWAHSQSQYISTGALHVFLPHKEQFEAPTLADCAANLAAQGIADDFPSPAARHLACLSAVYEFYIDGQPVTSSAFHMRELGHTRQRGLECWIDLADLPRGQHVLEVKFQYVYGREQSLVASIPFFHGSGAPAALPAQSVAPEADRTVRQD